jgi:hypothetical protein
MLKGHRHIGHGTSSVPSWDWERGWQAWPEGNVAVAAGDPIGPQEEILPIIQQFLASCQLQDWRVVFWQEREALVDLYRTAGLHVLKIGEDAILTTRTFTLAGKGMANVRSSAKRAEKEGVRAVFWHGPVQDAEQRAQAARPTPHQLDPGRPHGTEPVLRHEARPGHQVSHWPLPLACIGRQLRNDPWDQVLLYHDDHPKYAGQDETMDNRPAYDQALLAH